MTDANIIIKKIREEIESFSSSSAKDRQILFNNTTPELLSKLQRFLDSALSNQELFEQDDNEFIKEFYEHMGWNYID